MVLNFFQYINFSGRIEKIMRIIMCTAEKSVSISAGWKSKQIIKYMSIFLSLLYK